ncbi:Cytochrome P450 [Macrophomina phaseolina MS6]|uniref:Cytochrome P450 n=2 Tax=Macrophomina phaseolina TaxID=35725 RepID=K2R7V7_MACPH|nr:Cytochrome P450 [Macrophomina phaseolina MS6]KAH7014670.1 m-hydroxybenzyl alcohol hydroxylase [Macrophomina phaseolina]
MAITTIFLVLAASAVLLLLVPVGRRAKGLPPGPPTRPLIGNLHQLPKTGAHYKFTEWARTYGGIFSLKLGPATAVVITDRRLVKQLLDKKGNVYSNRPQSYVANELITGGDHLLVMQYGAKWRLFRRLVQNHFNETRCAHEHVALVEAEAAQMMHDVMAAPEDLMLHPKRFSNSIITSLVFGIRTPSVRTPHMLQLYDVMEKWSAVMETGATPPVDIFGFLKWVPEWLLGRWKTRARDVNKLMVALYGQMVGRVLKRREAGHRTVSFLDTVLDSTAAPGGGGGGGGEGLILTENELNFLAGVLMEGGSDTTASILLAFLQAMIKYPHVQQRAHAEIDALLGATVERSPRWDDYAHLPYVAQIVKETMRWRPVTPLGFPHATNADDIVDGYTIPKGTAVLLNVWGLHHEQPPSLPSSNNGSAAEPLSPFAFNPDRFAGRTAPASTYAASGDYAARDHYGYGAGRRLCPGIHLAERNLFVGVAKLLWAFTFSEKTGAEPVDVDPQTGYSEGFLHCAKPFACEVRVRGENETARTRRREVVLAEFRKAKGIFDAFEV